MLEKTKREITNGQSKDTNNNGHRPKNENKQSKNTTLKRWVTALVVIDTDCKGSCISNHHTITTTMVHSKNTEKLDDVKGLIRRHKLKKDKQYVPVVIWTMTKGQTIP